MAVTTTSTTLQSAVLQALQSAAQPTATSINMPNMVVLDEGSLGDFPWFWQNGTNFNAKTFAWLNNVFAYDSADQYLETNVANFMTSYFNVLFDISYVLNAADAGALNAAILANATVVNTVISDWTTTQGQIPATYTTQAAQLNYITAGVIAWGAPGLTLGQLRASVNPMALLPNVPFGADQLVNDFMTYLANTSSVANIQASVLSYNNQLNQTRANLTPTPATVTPGWMQTVDDRGVLAIVPQITVAESTANIQNNLIPSSGQGKNFTASIQVNKSSSNTVNVTASAGIQGSGLVADLFVFSGGASASYNLLTVDQSVTNIDVAIGFNGVTTVTPSPVSYAVSNGTGWWNPQPIQAAVGYSPSVSGYKFNQAPAYNFKANGNFGFLSRLMIAQQPTLTLTFYTSNYQSFQQTFQQQSHWGISFLGIPLAGGSQSYYSAQTSVNQSAGTVTVTMTPVGINTPVSPMDQLAYVIGAEVLWPGA